VSVPDGTVLHAGDSRAITPIRPGTGAHDQGGIGHLDRIRCLAHDGLDRIVSGGDDGTARLWRWEGGRLGGRATLRHPAGVACVAFADGGELIATGDSQRTIRIWHTNTATESVRIDASHSQPLTGLLLSRRPATGGGWRAVSAGRDGLIKLWSAGDGSEVATLRGHSGAVTRLGAPASGEWMASAGEDGTVRMWQIDGTAAADGGSVGHSGPVTAIVHDGPSGQTVTAGDDGRVVVWDPQGDPLRVAFGHLGSVTTAVALRPGRVATASTDRFVRCWDVDSGWSVARLGTIQGLGVPTPAGLMIAPGVALGADGHTSEVTHLARVDQRRVLSAGADRTVRLWDVDRGVQVRVVGRAAGSINCLVYVADLELVVVAGQSRVIEAWPLHGGPAASSIPGHAGGTTHLAADGEWLWSAGRDGRVKCWRWAAGSGLDVYGHHADGVAAAVTCLAVDSRRRRVVSADQAGTVVVRTDDELGPHRTEIAAHRGAVRALTTGADGLIYTCGDDQRLVVLTQNGDVVAQAHLPGITAAMLPIPSGGVVIGSRWGGISIFDLLRGVTRSGHGSP
jgi:WD40 repeat protein